MPRSDETGEWNLAPTPAVPHPATQWVRRVHASTAIPGQVRPDFQCRESSGHPTPNSQQLQKKKKKKSFTPHHTVLRLSAVRSILSCAGALPRCGSPSGARHPARSVDPWCACSRDHSWRQPLFYLVRLLPTSLSHCLAIQGLDPMLWGRLRRGANRFLFLFSIIYSSSFFNSNLSSDLKFLLFRDPVWCTNVLHIFNLESWQLRELGCFRNHK